MNADDGRTDVFRDDYSPIGEEDREETVDFQVKSFGARSIGILVLLGCFILSVLAMTNTSVQISSSSQLQPSAISSVTSLDDLPRHITYGNFSDSDQHHLFGLFQKKFGKKYNSTEYGKRFSVFKNQLKNADSRNSRESARGGTARHGITKFSDLTDEEFKSLNKAAKPIKRDDLPGVYVMAVVKDYTGSKTAIDWAGTLTTSVKDQGYCGSCWAFSTAAQIESDSIRLGLLTTSDNLSVQQLISCDTYDMGCDGGWTELGFEYVMENGLSLDSDYPYTAYYNDVGTCKADSSDFLVKVDQYYMIPTEDDMIDYVLSTGPLSACADSGEWGSYIDGIVRNCGDNVDHCVQIVGVDTDEGSWKVRNTWGTDWGEGGYIRLATGHNVCGIATDPIYGDISLFSKSSSSAKSSSAKSSPTKKPTRTPADDLLAPSKKPSTFVSTKTSKPTVTKTMRPTMPKNVRLPGDKRE